MKTNVNWKKQINKLPDELLERILMDSCELYHKYAKIVRNWEIIAVINILKNHHIEYKPSSIKNEIKKMIRYITKTLNKYGYNWKDMEFISFTQHFFDCVQFDFSKI